MDLFLLKSPGSIIACPGKLETSNHKITESQKMTDRQESNTNTYTTKQTNKDSKGKVVPHTNLFVARDSNQEATAKPPQIIESGLFSSNIIKGQIISQTKQVFSKTFPRFCLFLPSIWLKRP